MPRVSVVIPTYNRAHFVGRAIQSALDQRLDDLEVVVVDDGSTDDTRSVVSELGDRRIKYVYQPNRGTTAAFNRGLAESTGDYLSILGSDDWYRPDGLVPVYRELAARPELGLVSGGFHFVDETGRFLRESRPWRSSPRLDTETWLMSCPTLLQTSLVRRTWVERVGAFDVAVKVVQDWDYGLRLAHAGCAMGWIERPVFCYRLHRNQITRDASTIRRDYRIVLDKFFAQADLPPHLLAVKDRAYAHAYVKGAIRAFAAGQWPDGASDLERAIERDPSLLDQRGQRLFDALVGWAQDPQAVEPARSLDAAFAHLPAAAGPLKERRRAALAAVAMGRFFGAYEEGDLPTVRKAFWEGARGDPSWLFNRGVVSIAIRAHVGPLIAPFDRRASRTSPAGGTP